MATDSCQETLDELWDSIGYYEFNSRSCHGDKSVISSTDHPSRVESLSLLGDRKVKGRVQFDQLISKTPIISTSRVFVTGGIKREMPLETLMATSVTESAASNFSCSERPTPRHSATKVEFETPRNHQLLPSETHISSAYPVKAEPTAPNFTGNITASNTYQTCLTREIKSEPVDHQFLPSETSPHTSSTHLVNAEPATPNFIGNVTASTTRQVRSTHEIKSEPAADQQFLSSETLTHDLSTLSTRAKSDVAPNFNLNITCDCTDQTCVTPTVKSEVPADYQLLPPEALTHKCPSSPFMVRPELSDPSTNRSTRTCQPSITPEIKPDHPLSAELGQDNDQQRMSAHGTYLHSMKLEHAGDLQNLQIEPVSHSTLRSNDTSVMSPSEVVGISKKGEVKDDFPNTNVTQLADVRIKQESLEIDTGNQIETINSTSVREQSPEDRSKRRHFITDYMKSVLSQSSSATHVESANGGCSLERENDVSDLPDNMSNVSCMYGMSRPSTRTPSEDEKCKRRIPVLRLVKFGTRKKDFSLLRDLSVTEESIQILRGIKQLKRSSKCLRDDLFCEQAVTATCRKRIKLETDLDDCLSVSGFRIHDQGESVVGRKRRKRHRVPVIRDEDSSTEDEYDRSTPQSFCNRASARGAFNCTEVLLESPETILANGDDDTLGSSVYRNGLFENKTGIDVTSGISEAIDENGNVQTTESRKTAREKEMSVLPNGVPASCMNVSSNVEFDAESRDNQSESSAKTSKREHQMNNLSMNSSENVARGIAEYAHEITASRDCQINDQVDTCKDMVLSGVKNESACNPSESLATTGRGEQQNKNIPESEEDDKTCFYVEHLDKTRQESIRGRRAAAQKAQSGWIVDSDDSEEEDVQGADDDDDFSFDERGPYKRVVSGMVNNENSGQKKAARESKSAWYSDSEDWDSDATDDYYTKPIKKTNYLKYSNIDLYLYKKVEELQRHGRYLGYPPEDITKNFTCQYIGNSRALRFICKICNKDWLRIQTVITHSISHLKRNRHFCEKCGRTFNSEHIYKIHSDFHRLGMWREIEGSGSRRYTCPMCHKFFADQDSLIAHRREHAKERRPYECGVCGKKSTSTRMRQRHESSHKLKERRVKCKLCPATCSDRFTLKKHLRMHKLYNPEIGGYQCDECDATYRNLTYLVQHKKTHNANAMCERCGEAFLNDIHLARHMEQCKTKDPSLGHNAKIYDCEVCGKKFHLQALVKRHMTVHTRERKYACKHCDMSFQQSGARDRHEALHFKDGEFREVKKHPIKVKTGKDGRVYN